MVIASQRRDVFWDTVCRLRHLSAYAWLRSIKCSYDDSYIRRRSRVEGVDAQSTRLRVYKAIARAASTAARIDSAKEYRFEPRI